MYCGFTVSFSLIALLCSIGVANSERVVLGSFHKVHQETSSDGDNENSVIKVTGTPDKPTITFTTTSTNNKVSSSNSKKKVPNSSNQSYTLTSLNTRDPFNPNRKVVFTNFNRKDPLNPNRKVGFTNLPTNNLLNPNRQVVFTHFSTNNSGNQNRKEVPLNPNQEVVFPNFPPNFPFNSKRKVVYTNSISNDPLNPNQEVVFPNFPPNFPFNSKRKVVYTNSNSKGPLNPNRQAVFTNFSPNFPFNANQQALLASLNTKGPSNPIRKAVYTHLNTRVPFNPNQKVVLTNFHTNTPIKPNQEVVASNSPTKDQGTPNRKVYYINFTKADQHNPNPKVTVTTVEGEDADDSDKEIMLGDKINEKEDNDDETEEMEEEEEDTDGRIIGGRVVSIDEVPWQVAIQRDDEFVCGGSLVSTVWVLTAAHCLSGYDSSSFAVRAGSNRFDDGGQVRRAGFLAVHGRYNATQYDFDIGMIRVNRRFIYGTKVQPVGLATPNTLNPGVFFASGWGSVSQTDEIPSDVLRGVPLNFVNRLTCAALNSGPDYLVPRTGFCAGNLLVEGGDTCDYDDGGPLVSGAVQFGIVSNATGCGDARRPGVYTNVGYMAPWIVNVARSFNKRSYPDEIDGYDIRRVIIDNENDPEPADIKIKISSCVNCPKYLKLIKD